MPGQLYGHCEICQHRTSRNRMAQHLLTHQDDSGDKGTLIEARGHGPLGLYWLLVALPETATLADLDDFLRKIWLGWDHLSSFVVDQTSYDSNYDHLQDGFTDPRADEDYLKGLFLEMNPNVDPVVLQQRVDASLARFVQHCDMNTPAQKALSSKTSVVYEYDYGSTTTLEVTNLGSYCGDFSKPRLTLLARNEVPDASPADADIINSPRYYDD